MARAANRPRRNRYAKNQPSPLELALTPLPLDGATEEELLMLTWEQAAKEFMSRWVKVMEPQAKCRSRWVNEPHLLARVQKAYVVMVLDEEWSEYKFVASLDRLLRGTTAFTHANLTSIGEGIKLEEGS